MPSIEVIRIMLELSDTVSNALEYIQAKINELKFEVAYEMLSNVLVCIVEIEQIMT